ncbi:MAG TPA: ArdC-like ssDNA-binding domain-containing protein, partial [Caulobacter sp.]|nr:ArdC-like ssDNA-binding domain-containing protein [Caulobacter sp.]
MPRATAQTRRNGKTSDTQSDLYTRVTGQILADLAQGVRPWTRPWASAHPAGSVRRPLRHNLIPYSGINTVLLWARAMAQGYGAPIWMTFRQAIELGGCVRRGERATTIVYANRLSRTEAGEDGHDVERSIPFLKAYGVFNIEQIDGLPESFAPAPVDPLPQSARRDLLSGSGRRRRPCRRPGLVCAGSRSHPDAALRGVSIGRGLLRHPRSRMRPLDPSSVPAGSRPGSQGGRRRRLCP